MSISLSDLPSLMTLNPDVLKNINKFVKFPRDFLGTLWTEVAAYYLRTSLRFFIETFLLKTTLQTWHESHTKALHGATTTSGNQSYYNGKTRFYFNSKLYWYVMLWLLFELKRAQLGHLISLEEPEHDEHTELPKKSKMDTEMYKLHDGEVQRSMQLFKTVSTRRLIGIG